MTDPSAEHTDETEEGPEPAPDGDDSSGYQTLAHGHLSPRHRRFAQLVASGATGTAIKEETGYSDSRISVLKKDPHITAEIARIQERIYEETIGSRLKTFAEPALAVLERALTDKTNRVKESEKIDVAKWVIEKIDGKATQKYDVGENMLSVLMDRLDSIKAGGHQFGTRNPHQAEAIDVTPQDAPQLNAPPAPKTEEDLLSDWVTDFNRANE